MTAWFDAATWVQDHLTKSCPDWLVAPETDSKITRYPALVWSLALSNPDPLGIWSATLTVSLLCTPQQASAGAQQVHDAVQGWQTPGPLHSVELTSFTQNPSTASKPIHQYIFVYSLTWDR